MARTDDTGIPPTDARDTQITKGARVVYATTLGHGLLQEGVITRVTPGICIRHPDGKSSRLARRSASPYCEGWPASLGARTCRPGSSTASANREHALGCWADEELRLAHERLKQRRTINGTTGGRSHDDCGHLREEVNRPEHCR